MKKITILFVVLSCQLTIIKAQQWKPAAFQLATRWSKEVSPSNALKEYPRPQMQRSIWQNLNGLWEYGITNYTNEANFTNVKMQGKILVPYPIESQLSGVKKALQPDQLLWYKRSFDKLPAKSGAGTMTKGERTLIHFGAVDYQCWVYVNGKKVGQHEGGYTEFSFDITGALKNGANELIVKVYDPSDAGIGPRGKQVLSPQSIYYTPSSGIWQTVWMEIVPETYIESLEMTPDIDKGVLHLKVNVAGKHDNYFIVTTLVNEKSETAWDKFEIDIPIKDLNLWTPGKPFLYDLHIGLYHNEKKIDFVKTYFGMRKVEIKKSTDGYDRIFLNNKAYYNLGVLDQGFWPDGLHTAPTDEALKFDIEAIKQMGFNTIRKHIKVEPARWYYHADKIGMLVWQDFVQPNPSLPTGAKEIFEQQGAEMMKQLHNYPCITTWVLFNEKWGAYDQQRLTEWIKKTDPSRLVNGHSGEILYVNEKLRSPSPNAYVSSDISDIHSYPDPMNAKQQPGKARVLGEFGGIGVFIPDHQWNSNSAWGYINVTPAALKAKYQVMNQHLQLLEKEGLSASIYTQPFDVEGEQNGLMTYDREVIKIPFAELRKIHAPLNKTIGAIPKVTAKNADLTEPAQLYADMFQQYVNGKKDAAFLKRLTMMAIQNNDAAGKNRFAAEYITKIQKPYSTDDFAFIEASTKIVSDPGFMVLIEHEKELTGKEQRTLRVKLMNIIYQDVIASYVPNAQAKPDWNELEEKIKAYGAPGEEIYLRAKTIHTYNQSDWTLYIPTATVYVEKYGSTMKPDEKKMFSEAIEKNK